MILIETRNIANNTSIVNFANIPQIYSDLLVKVSAYASNNRRSMHFRLNGATSGYSYFTAVLEDGANKSYDQNAYFGGTSNFTFLYAGTFATGGDSEIYIPNYRNSENKSIFAEFAQNSSSATGSVSGFVTGLLSNTAPVTSLSLFVSDADFAPNTTISLYGIESGTDGIVTIS
jgi:hypothetical protein